MKWSISIGSVLKNTRSLLAGIGLGLALIAAVAVSKADAATAVTVSWQQPASTDYLAGYRVRWSKSEDAASATVIDAGGPATLTEYRLDALPDEKTWVWVQVYDVLGQSSEWSLPVVKPAKPDILQNVKIVITVSVP